MIERVFLIVLDSAGIGAMPDAKLYGDEGSNTLGNIALQVGLHIPNMQKMGLGNITELHGINPVKKPTAAWGKMAELSPGKDTITGHWEIAGVVLEKPFKTFPQGFPQKMIEQFEKEIGRKILGNVVASGTEIIKQLGQEHMETGKPIVYTSADSVFQIAAHIWNRSQLDWQRPVLSQLFLWLYLFYVHRLYYFLWKCSLLYLFL
jgi:phosphopentomutase